MSIYFLWTLALRWEVVCDKVMCVLIGFAFLPRYIHKGNSKFGAITIENLEGGDQSSLKYRLFIDGKEAWNTVLLSPAKRQYGNSGGSFWGRLGFGG